MKLLGKTLLVAALLGVPVAIAQISTGGGGGGMITGPVGPSTAPASAVATTDTGTPITGQTLPAGGQGLIGWISYLISVASQSIPAGTNTIGSIGNSAFGISGTLPAFAATPTFNIGTAPTIVANIASSTSGGTTNYSLIAANNTTGISIKAAPGTVFSLQLGGVGSVPAYAKLYDTASAPTCGSGTPVGRFIIPAASTAANGGGSNIDFAASGRAFVNGIGLCVTAGLADADTTAPAASTYLVNMGYK